MIVAVLLVGQMASSFPNQGLPTLYPFIQEAFKLSRAELGLISSGIILGTSATILILGWLVDTLGVRKVITISPFCVAALVLLFSQARSLVHAIILAFFVTAAGSGIYPSSTKGIVQWVRPQYRGLSMGIAQTSLPICGISTALLLPYVAETFNWRIAVSVLALMIAVVAVVVFRFYRDNPESGLTKELRSNPLRSINLIARNRDIWLACMCTMTLNAMQLTFMAYVILFLTQELDMSAVAAGGFLAVFQATAAVWIIGWGLVSDFLLRGRRVMTLALMGMASVMSMGLLAWLPSDASPLVVGLVMGMVGVGFMGWPGLLPALLAELAGPGLTGTAIGFGTTFMRIGVFATPPLFGLVVDRTDSYDLGWWMLAGIAVAGTATLVFMRPQAHRQ